MRVELSVTYYLRAQYGNMFNLTLKDVKLYGERANTSVHARVIWPRDEERLLEGTSPERWGYNIVHSSEL